MSDNLSIRSVPPGGPADTVRTVTPPPQQVPALATPPVPAALVQDKTQVATLNKGRAVPSLSLAAPPPVDLRNILPGFRSGNKIDVGATGLEGLVVGGDGQIGSLSATSLKMSLHIKAPGVNQRMNVDLRSDGNGFHLYSPENWQVSVAKVGDWYRLTNQADSKQYIEIKSTGSGEARIRTHGMAGVDGHTLTIEVD